MMAVIQRVSNASVKVDEEIVGEISTGFLILLGVCEGDTETDVQKLVSKIPVLRIFKDENHKMNLSLLDVGGEALVVSQFTLCADCSHGRRPSFISSAKPEDADKLYQLFSQKLRSSGVKKVENGVFGADMKVSLLNDGPVTIVLNSKELK